MYARYTYCDLYTYMRDVSVAYMDFTIGFCMFVGICGRELLAIELVMWLCWSQSPKSMFNLKFGTLRLLASIVMRHG